MTYVLKHDLISPSGTVLKKAGEVVGLYDRYYGKLVTDLDNWSPPPEPTAPTGLVYGKDEAPPGWKWIEESYGRDDDQTRWTIVKDPLYASAPAPTRWDLTPEEKARQDAHDAYAASQRKRDLNPAPAQMPAAWMPNTTPAAGAPRQNPVKAIQAAMPSAWKPWKWRGAKTRKV
jgi:hypothetical protein